MFIVKTAIVAVATVAMFAVPVIAGETHHCLPGEGATYDHRDNIPDKDMDGNDVDKGEPGGRHPSSF